MNLARTHYRLCCRTPQISLSNEDLELQREDVFLNHPQVIQSRRNLLNGIKDDACKSCWDMEDSGMESARQNWRGTELFYNSSYQSDSHSPFAERLEIVLDDICNLECLYCGPLYSTKWQTRQGIVREKADTRFEERFWKWFDSAAGNLKWITISGGEPFLSTKLDGVLDRIWDFYGPRESGPQVSIITNLSYPQQALECQLARLRQLSRRSAVVVEFSNESFGAKSEYIRWGLKWDEFSKNLNYVISAAPELYFAAQMAMNSFCISSLSQYLEFLWETHSRTGVEIFPVANYVTDTPAYNPKILTEDFAEYLNAALDTVAKFAGLEGPAGEQWRKYEIFLNSIRETILEARSDESIAVSRAQFAKRVRWLDENRKSNFARVFPEYAEFYEMCARLESSRF